jgi:VIT1/CCC1 family predicted Fe2+/Mn2+ transporter
VLAVVRSKAHSELHRSGRTGWLRAAVLGSNDAIVSTASLMIGVAASAASTHAILVAGVAGLVAGAMSMAVGEFLSVSSQRDAERADIELEKQELAANPKAELRELEGIYLRRGLDAELAHRVAVQLSDRDRLSAHLRDELGITAGNPPRPLQAAWVSAASFASFAAIPIVALIAAPSSARAAVIVGTSLVALGALGGLGASLGGAPLSPAVLRVTVGGALAMAVTAGIGRLLGIAAG